MPVDQRRINGPEVTVPYQLYIDASLKSADKQLDLLDKRKDGRTNNDVRKMCRLCFCFPCYFKCLNNFIILR